METDLIKRLAEVQEELIDTSIKYQNMRDRQSFKTLGITTGIALAFIGVTLGHNWTMRIALFLVSALIILAAVYGIKRIDRKELEDLGNQVKIKKEQVNDLKKAIRQLQVEQNKR